MSSETPVEIKGIVTKPFGEGSRSGITTLSGIGNVVVRCCEIYQAVLTDSIDAGNDSDAAKQAAVSYCREECRERHQILRIPPAVFSAGAIELGNESDLMDLFAEADGPTYCPEQNTQEAYVRLMGSEQFLDNADSAITIAVTDNRVGFDDMFHEYAAEGIAGTNPSGWREASGFNAFFADTSNGVTVLGRRLADCGDLNIEFQTNDGRTIIGFMHLTRPKQMMGHGVERFGDDGSQSYVEHALSQALSHYGEVDPASVSISLRTAINAEDFVKHFDSKEAMEGHLPGWYDDGLLQNVSNPDWSPDDGYDKNDEWHADFRGIVMRDIEEAMNNLDIPSDNFDTSEMLDTMHSEHHSSHERAKREGLPDTRDLYVTQYLG
ncbi:MAG: hypothetical protein AAF413_01515 [Patescibacteria group bacterium]